VDAVNNEGDLLALPVRHMPVGQAGLVLQTEGQFFGRSSRSCFPGHEALVELQAISRDIQSVWSWDLRFNVRGGLQ